jgi:nucleoid-associated protein YgaU
MTTHAAPGRDAADQGTTQVRPAADARDPGAPPASPSAPWPDLAPPVTSPHDLVVRPAPHGVGAPGTPPRSAPEGRTDAPEVIVHRGDSLWAIAARHLGPGATNAAIAAEWPRWWAANRDVIGPDPDLILPGQRLTPPSGP